MCIYIKKKTEEYDHRKKKHKQRTLRIYKKTTDSDYRKKKQRTTRIENKTNGYARIKKAKDAVYIKKKRL